MVLWTPSNLLILPKHWFDAQDAGSITQSGGTVSVWADKGSGGIDGTQGATGSQPAYVASSNINANPALRWDGSNDFLAATFGTGAGIDGCMTKFFANYATTSFSIETTLSDASAPTNSSSTITNLATAALIAATGNGTALDFWYTGNSINTVTLGATVVNDFALFVATRIGGAGGVNQGRWLGFSGIGNYPPLNRSVNGDIGEIIYLSYAPTATERQLIEGYLAWRWGLESQLPGGHPYASAAPQQIVSGDMFGLEGADSAALQGDVIVAGSLTATEGADVASWSGDVGVSGTAAAIEGADSATFAGGILATGALAGVEGADVLSAFGGILATGSLDATEGGDVAALTGRVTVAGTLDATEGADVISMSGLVLSVIASALAATEGADLFLATGYQAVAGTLAAVEGSDTALLAGTVVTGGMLAAIEGADTGAFAGAVPVTGQLAAIESADVLGAAGAVTVKGAMAAIEGADTTAISGTVLVSGALAAIEGADSATFAGQAFDDIAGELAGTDGADVLAMAGQVRNRSQWVLKWA